MALRELFRAHKTCTTCPYCGVGCGVSATLQSQGGEQRVSIAGDEQHPANSGRLCVKGAALAETLGERDRLLRPRLHGREHDWDSALDFLARQLKNTIEEHGPDSVAFYLSGQLLTEDYYVANKLMKGFIGSGNVDTNSRLCMSSAVAAYKRAFGADAVPCCYEDLEQAQLIVLIGSNAAWTHPILFQRMQTGNAKLVVIDPRASATSEMADQHLAIKPGTDAALFNGLLCFLAKANSLDREFIEKHTENFSQTLEAVSSWTPQKTAEYCGLAVSELMEFFTIFSRSEKTISFYSQGINQSSSGTDKNNAVINCHLATGRIGIPGAGPFSITGQPNAMGGREVGGLANMLAAHMDFDPQHIKRVGRFWNAPRMAQSPGLKAVDLFQAVESGQIKAIWIMATNPAVSMPDAARVTRALQNCPLVIVSDCVANTDTARCADLLLPATTWGEKNGTVTNSERRISRQRGFLPAPGEALDDWKIVCNLAARMGFGESFNYSHPAEIFREHAALSGFENNAQHGLRAFDISALAKLNQREYDQLQPVQWPVNKANPAGRQRLFSDGHFYTESGRAQFVPITPREPQQARAASYPLWLNSGRLRDQWHTMTRTGRARKLLDHSEGPEIQLHPRDAASYGIKDAQLVQVQSAQGTMIGRAKLMQTQQPGQLFAPIHWSDSFAQNAKVSALAAAITDPISGQPEFKQLPVRLQPLSAHSYATLICRTQAADRLHRWLSAAARPDSERQEIVHWYRLPVAAGYRYELALGKSIDWRALGELLLEDQQMDLHWQRLQLFQAERWLAYSKQAEWIVFTSADWQSLPDRRALEASLVQPIPALPAQLLRDLPASAQMVCTCMQVSRTQIDEAIAAGADSVEILGEQLGCGTNCGSCKPEIAGILRGLAENAA